MARKGTIAYAEKNLTPEQYAAWLAMPVKLSKKQLIAGELPPKGDPSADAPLVKEESKEEESEEYDLVGGITLAAMQHGQETESDAEIAALQAALAVFWECMDSGSRERAFESETLVEMLKDLPDESDGDGEEGDEESETE